MDKQEQLKINNKKLEEINLELTNDKITKEKKQYLQKKLLCITEHNEKINNDSLKIVEKLNKVINEKKENCIEKSKKM